MALTKPSVMNIWANAISGSLSALFSVPTIIDSGWPAPSGTPVKPLIGDFNWLFNYVINGVRYLCARGMSDWDAAETQYVTGAQVREPLDGSYWVLIGTATTGLAPHSDTTNWQRWFDSPFARGLSWTREIISWKNARGQRRFGVDHFGYPNGQIIQWDENWDQNNLSSGSWIAADVTYPITADETFSYGIGKWAWRASCTGASEGRIRTMAPTNQRWHRVLRISFPAPSGGIIECGLLDVAATSVFSDDMAITLDWNAEINGSGTTGGDTIVMGFRCDNQRINAINDGMFFIKGTSDTNWQCRCITAGVPQSFDSGVSAGTTAYHRFRIAALGSSVNDNASREVRFFIDDTNVGVITSRIPVSSGTDLRLEPVFGGFSGAASDVISLDIGPVRYRQNSMGPNVFP
jgi:hypothetical protein